MPFIYIISFGVLLFVTQWAIVSRKTRKVQFNVSTHCLPLFWIMHQTTLLVALSKRDCTICSHFRALGGKAARIILTE